MAADQSSKPAGGCAPILRDADKRLVLAARAAAEAGNTLAVIEHLIADRGDDGPDLDESRVALLVLAKHIDAAVGVVLSACDELHDEPYRDRDLVAQVLVHPADADAWIARYSAEAK